MSSYPEKKQPPPAPAAAKSTALKQPPTSAVAAAASLHPPHRQQHLPILPQPPPQTHRVSHPVNTAAATAATAATAKPAAAAAATTTKPAATSGGEGQKPAAVARRTFAVTKSPAQDTAGMDNDDILSLSSSSCSSSSTDDSETDNDDLSTTSSITSKQSQPKGNNNTNDDNEDDEMDENKDDVMEMITVASQSTPYQMQLCRPILLGQNRSNNTLNVQLPNSVMIVVDADSFPEYDRDTEARYQVVADKKRALQERQKQEKHREEQRQKQERLKQALAERDAAEPKPKTHRPAAAIPLNASAVVHVMDRRVNLDTVIPPTTATLAPARSSNTPHAPPLPLHLPMYRLLRAWVQDDPYRYVPPPEDCTDAIKGGQQEQERSPRWATTTQSLQVDDNDDEDQSEVQTSLPPNDETTVHVDILSSLSQTFKQKNRSSPQKGDTQKEHSVQDLRQAFLTKARQKRLQANRPRKRRKELQFRQALQSLERRGLCLKKKN